jgi:hypothetical protein
MGTFDRRRFPTPSRTRLQTVSGFAVVVALVLAGCETTPVRSPPPPPPVSVPTTVYAYPRSGQTPAQLDRDRYECHVWAVRQSGFDPSRQAVAPQQSARVVVPSGPSSVLPGAAIGAGIGALAGSPWNPGAGALAGAAAGAVAGAAADTSRANRANQVAQAQQANADRNAARVAQNATNYRRALSACLEGRGYSVS